MTVLKETGISRYIGLAGDTKPTGVPVGSTFLEYDTDALFVTHDGTNWVQVDKLVRSAQLPTALAAGGGLKVEGVAGGVSLPVTAAQGAAGAAAWPVAESPVAAAAADVHAPAANTAAVVTYAAAAALKHVITGIAWSYVGGIPTGGNLKVEDVAGTTVFTLDIDESGAGVIVFPKPKKAAAVNTAMIITLAAGGAGVTGKVAILNHFTEA